jgi:hypothetical protein
MHRRHLLLALLAAPLASAGRRRDNPEACARLDDRLLAIEREKRQGYSAKRGRKLQLLRERLASERRKNCR